MQAIVDTLVSYYKFFIAFIVDVVQSIKDFILDLPVIILETGTKILTWLLEKLASYCSYCLGGTSFDGTSSAVSRFAQSIQSAYDSLSPCVVYALTQSGIAGDLQILSCAMVVWTAMRLVSLVKLVRG